MSGDYDAPRQGIYDDRARPRPLWCYTVSVAAGTGTAHVVYLDSLGQPIAAHMGLSATTTQQTLSGLVGSAIPDDAEGVEIWCDPASAGALLVGHGGNTGGTVNSGWPALRTIALGKFLAGGRCYVEEVLS